MDEQLSVMRYNVADAAISMVLVYLLLPVLGIKGYILVIVLSEVFNFSLSLGRLIRVAKFEVDITERVVKPLLCAAISVLAARILSRAGLPLPGSPIGFALLLALVSTGCYLLLLHLAGCDPRRV
ncbi:MAG: polysaccharide biosynthesis C-terminal domain-containing protein [Anaerotruncus massiliensis (ex Togo et al. 2019)]